MQLLTILLVFGAGCCLVTSHPAKSAEHDVELVGIHEHPIDDADEDIEGIMRRIFNSMQTQLKHIFSFDRLPDFGDLGNFGIPTVNLDEGNKTSESKIVDGHKITTNTTTYNKDGVFVKVFNTEVEPSGEGKLDADAETIDELNEIPRRQNSFYDNLEPFDDVDNNLQYYETFEPIDDDRNDIESNQQPQSIRYLGDDILVNQMLADAGAPKNPDAEYIDFDYDKRNSRFKR